MTAADMTAAATPEANADRLLFLEREVARYEALACDALYSDEDNEAFCHAAAEHEALIAEAPCDSHAAVTVKLRTVVRTAVVEGCIYRGLDAATMIDGIVAFMEGQGTARRPGA